MFVGEANEDNLFPKWWRTSCQNAASLCTFANGSIDYKEKRRVHKVIDRARRLITTDPKIIELLFKQVAMRGGV